MAVYQDPSRTIEERVEDLLQRMTLTEKVGQLNQHLYGWQSYEKTGQDFVLTETFKNEVEKWGGIGTLYGLFRADPWSGRTYENGLNAQDSPKVANKIQQYILDHTRLGIPALLSEETPHGHQALDGTVIPTNIGSGSTWNPELMQDMYEHIAKEIRARGAHLGLISTLDIVRDPRWGRTEESFSEDPYLASKMTEAAVYGLQGSSKKDLKRNDKIGAVLKHFAAQGSGEGGINAAPALIGERELYDIHLPAMRAGAEAGAVGCMAAYNEIDGIPCHANKELLTDILRDEMNFDGIVMADGVAIDRLNMLTGSYEKSAAMALSAGVNVSLWDKSFTTLEEAVNQGYVSEEAIDQSVRLVLRLKFSLGLFENRFVDEGNVLTVVGTEETRQKNLQVAQESIVLLKNERVLPLSKSVRKIAVIGPNAHSVYNLLGDYTANQKDGKIKTIYEAIRDQATDIEVHYAKGCGILDESKDGFAEAVALAEQSDVVILAVGGSSARNFDMKFDKNGAAILDDQQPSDMDCGEGVDVADLKLGGVQEQLIETIAAVGKPTIGVVIQGRPYAIESLVDACQGVICGWYPGAEGSQAIADVLFGKVNPSGKLSVSIPRSSSQLPTYYNKKDLGQVLHYHDQPSTPLFPFGYGLSYTTFQYSELKLSQNNISISALEKGEKITIEVTVENTGDYDGSDVVQLYRYDETSSVTKRVRELKGFQKIHLEPGEKKTVSFQIGKEEMGVWNHAFDYVLEPKKIQWYVGNDSKTDTQVTLTLYEK